MATTYIGYICFGFFFFIFFFGGIFAIYKGYQNRQKAGESQNWPSTGGQVTRAWVAEQQDTDEDGYTSTTYVPRIEYQYEVAGQTYTSTKRSFGGVRGYGRRSKAEEEINRSPVNSRVHVYYNPADHSEGVLVRGTKGTMGGIIAGAILLIVGICGLCGTLYFLVMRMQF